MIWSFILILYFLKSTLGLYSSSANVIELRTDNFNRLVLNSDKIWLVEFFAPWCPHCQNLSPEYIQAADALKGIIKVGAVNIDNHKDLVELYAITGIPTVQIFGLNKNKPEDYTGERTAKALVEAALKVAIIKASSFLSERIDQKDVIELTDTNFSEHILQSDDPWLVEFYAPWCTHCKDFAPHWSKAAAQLKGKVKLGSLDAIIHRTTSNKYGIQSFPTIKFFAPGGAKDSPIDYNGERTSGHVVDWVLQKVAEHTASPQIHQITNESFFEDICRERVICIVAVLPHILDCASNCRNKYFSIMKKVAEKLKKNMWGLLWSEARSQPDLEKALNIDGIGYPAMAVLNARNMRFSLLRGAFTEDGIYQFLIDLLAGRGQVYSLRSSHLPKIYKIRRINYGDANNLLDGKDEL